MIVKMLQVDRARVIVGSSSPFYTSISFLPIGVRGGDTITINGTRLPVTQLVNEMFNITIRASDMITLKMSPPVSSVEMLEDTSTLPVSSIPLILKVGSKAGSPKEVLPLLTPDPGSQSLSRLTVDQMAVIDGIPLVLKGSSYVDVSEVTVVPSRMVDVPYINFSLDAILVPAWIAERTAGEWMGRVKLAQRNMTTTVNSNALNAFLRSNPYGDSDDVELRIFINEEGQTIFARRLAESGSFDSHFQMDLPENAVLVAFQRSSPYTDVSEIPPLVDNVGGWDDSWRALMHPETDPKSLTPRRTVLVSSCLAKNVGSWSFPTSWNLAPAATFSGPVQFVILHNPTWPLEGLPKGDPALGLRTAVVPRLSNRPVSSISLDGNMDITIAGRDFRDDPAPFNIPVSHLTRGRNRSALFSGTGQGSSDRINLFSRISPSWSADLSLTIPGDGADDVIPISNQVVNGVPSSSPAGDVLNITSSGPVGANVMSMIPLRGDSTLFIYLPVLVSWAAQR